MKRFFCVLFVASFVLSSCAVLDRRSTIYYNEKELSLDDITEMRYSFEEDPTSEKNAEFVPYGDVFSEECVYWTESGSVWHLTSDCGYLSGAEKIIYGSEADAVKLKKTRICSLCDKNK